MNRVTLPSMYNSITQDLQRLLWELQQVNNSIASGKKYDNIAANPLDVQTAMGYHEDLKQTDQFQRNLQTAQTWLEQTESTMQNLGDLIKEASVLAEQMATGTYNDDNRAAAARKVQNILEETVQEANIQVNGQFLLSGYKTDTPPFVLGDLAIQAPAMRLESTSTFAGQATSSGTYTETLARTYLVEITSVGAVGAAQFRVSDDGGQTWAAGFTTAAAPTAIWGSDLVDRGVEIAFNGGGNFAVGDRFVVPVSRVTYQGDDNTLEVDISKTNRLAINAVGREVVDGASGNNDVFQILSRLQSGLEADDQNLVAAALEELKEVHSNLLQYQGDVGARIDRVIYKQDAYTYLTDSLTAGLSTVEDTDLINATKELNLKQAAYQAALLSSTKVLNLSLMDYMT